MPLSKTWTILLGVGLVIIGAIALTLGLVLTRVIHLKTTISVTVKTDCGNVSGVLFDGVYTFQGIPYARPPINTFRWKPSITLAAAKQCWNGTYGAYLPGPLCQQTGLLGLDSAEDCLTLNVWTPVLNRTAKLPVLFYIHGGSLVEGGSDIVPTVPSSLAKSGLVVVSANYRLNVFGFLALDVLSSHDPRNVSGNYGLTDVMTALEWIQTNIKNFSGDPSQVTIWGQSSGGSLVYALTQVTNSSQLFARAVTMSGSPHIIRTLPEATSFHAQTYLPQTACANAADVYGCLMNETAVNLVNAYPSDLWNPSWLFGIPRPNDTIAPLLIRDNVTLPLEPIPRHLSMIIGNMQEEADLEPEDLVINDNATTYEALIQSRFDALAPNLSQAVMSLYPLSDFDSPQQAYDQISADSLVICPNLIEASLRGQVATIYSYLATIRPPLPFCIVSTSYCSRYAFHTFDLFLLDDNLIPLSPNESKFRSNLLSAMVEFVTNGTISSWQTVHAINATTVTTQLLNDTVTIATNVRQDKCNFWTAMEFQKYWWQN
jgi:carboxylesterase type B